MKFCAIDFETQDIPYFNKKGKNKNSFKGHPRFANAHLMSYSNVENTNLVVNPDPTSLPLTDTYVFHNLSFDWLAGLHSNVFSEYDSSKKTLHCTAVMARLLKNDRPAKLKSLAKTILGVKVLSYDEAKKAGTAIFQEYARNDALFTAQLYPIFKSELEENDQWILYEIERDFVLFDLACQRNGFSIDRQKLSILTQTLSEKIKIQREGLNDSVNWNSPLQVKKVVFGDWGLPLVFHKGKVSTSQKALVKLKGDPRIDELLLFKETQALLKQGITIDRFTDKQTNRMHPHGNTLGADTGRCTSSNPNMQNMKRGEEIRGLFTASQGHKLLVFDFSQVEPRVLAHFLHESDFSALFFSSDDCYEKLAKELLSSNGRTPSRAIAKEIILATFYGMSEKSLASKLNVTIEEGIQLRGNFFGRYPELVEFREHLLNEARRTGFAQGLFNRRRYVEDLHDQDRYLKEAAERKVLNAVIQGSATTLFKYKLNRLYRELPQMVRYLLHIHDEVIFEVPDDHVPEILDKAKTILEAPEPWFSIPLKVEGGFGENWASAKSNGKEVKNGHYKS